MASRFGNFYEVRDMRAGGPLTDDQMYKLAPSVFATRPWEGCSEKFAFIPTMDIVRGMRSEGFLPVAVRQGRTRVPGKGFFTKHEIRFRMPGASTELQTRKEELEVVFRNAHDRTACGEIDFGAFVINCLNGLITKSAGFDSVKVTHRGRAAESIVEAAYRVVQEAPKVAGLIETLKGTNFSREEQRALANAGLALRFDADEELPVVSLDDLNRVRRRGDEGNSAWMTFNRIQESLIRGGPAIHVGEGERRRSLRPINAISEDTRINRGLWILTEAFVNMKNGTHAAV